MIEEANFDEATMAALNELPCCKPLTEEDLKWCMHCGITHKEPSVWIIEEYMDDESYFKVSACNNHVLSYLVGENNATDPHNCAFQTHGDKFVITKRERLN